MQAQPLVCYWSSSNLCILLQIDLPSQYLTALSKKNLINNAAQLTLILNIIVILRIHQPISVLEYFKVPGIYLSRAVMVSNDLTDFLNLILLKPQSG